MFYSSIFAIFSFINMSINFIAYLFGTTPRRLALPPSVSVVVQLFNPTVFRNRCEILTLIGG